MAGDERVGRLGREPRGFVDRDADAVAEAVAEVLAETGGLDRIAGERIGFDAGEPRLDVRAGALLRGQADVVGLPQAAGHPARRERARAVAAVAVDPHPPVDRDERAALDDLVGRMAVRPRAVLARRDDRVERELVGPVRVQQLAQPPGELALGAADPGLCRQRFETAVGDLRRAAELRDFLFVFHGAHRVDDSGRRHELRAAGLQPVPFDVGQHVRLELDAPLQPCADVLHQAALRQLHLDVGHLLRRLDVAKVGVERRRSIGLDEQRGVRAVEARQVEDVHQVRHKQRRVQAFAQRLQPCVHAGSFPARNSIASR